MTIVDDLISLLEELGAIGTIAAAVVTLGFGIAVIGQLSRITRCARHERAVARADARVFAELRRQGFTVAEARTAVAETGGVEGQGSE